MQQGSGKSQTAIMPDSGIEPSSIGTKAHSTKVIVSRIPLDAGDLSHSVNRLSGRNHTHGSKPASSLPSRTKNATTAAASLHHHETRHFDPERQVTCGTSVPKNTVVLSLDTRACKATVLPELEVMVDFVLCIPVVAFAACI